MTMTTSSKLKALWVDDDVGRRNDVRNLCDRQLVVDFKHASKIADIDPRELTKYHLLIVDYRLDRSIGTFRGPAVVGLLRSLDDDIPAYLVTGEPVVRQETFVGLTWFDEIVQFREMQEARLMRARLKRDIAGYNAIRALSRGPAAMDRVTKLLKAPRPSHDVVRDAIPAELRNALCQNVGTGIANAGEVSGKLGFARWVRRWLLRRPGPLLSALHAATRVGMTVSRFEKSVAFGKCRYDGIFASKVQNRWWTDCLDETVFARRRTKPKIPSGPPWVVGPQVFGVPERDRPRCAVCQELVPETVARNEGEPEEERAVHIRCSMPDPDRDFASMFHEERIFSADRQ